MTSYSNGRPTTYSGTEVINAVNPQSNRVILIPDGNSYKQVSPYERYDLMQLFRKNGMPAVVDTPLREKGNY